jgi:hypothetical protein
MSGFKVIFFEIFLPNSAKARERNAARFFVFRIVKAMKAIKGMRHCFFVCVRAWMRVFVEEVGKEGQ